MDDTYTYQTVDKTEYLYAFHGVDFLCALWDLDQWLRGHVKYNGEGLSEDAIDALDKARDELRQIMENHGVSLEMLR